MAKVHVYSLVWLHLLLLSQAAELSYDIVIYGATPAGITAAIAAANGGQFTVALIDPASNFGGMSVAGGIGLRDIGTPATLNGTALKWAMMNAAHYNVNYPVWQPDMPVGEANFRTLLKQEPSIDLHSNEPLYEGPDNVVKVGTIITKIATGLDAASLTIWNGKVFIDASYEGDLARAAKASYTFGRESASQYNETYGGVRSKWTDWGNFDSKEPVSATYDNDTLIPYVNAGPLAPQGSADDKMMGYSYRVCITARSTNKAPFPKPPGYNPDDFVLLQRYLDYLVAFKYPKGPPLNFPVGLLDYRSYPPGDKYDMCDSQSAVTSDVINLNAGYVTGTRAQRKLIEDKHYYYIAGFLTYLATDPRVPAFTRNDTLRYGLCKDQWPENNHWPTQMYVREGLRIIGDRVTTQNDLIGGRCINDSIGVGSWEYDIHVVQRVAVASANNKLAVDNEGQIMTGTAGGAVYELSYSLLLPKRTEVTNLLVPVCHSASHVAYSALRVEPTFMQLGQASGVAATIAIKDKLALHDVPIKTMQPILLQQGINLHWPPTHCNK